MNRVKPLLVGMGMAAMVLGSGCTVHLASSNSASTPDRMVFQPLNRGEYSVLRETAASASGWSLFWGLMNFVDGGDRLSTLSPRFGIFGESAVEAAAKYDALEKVPGADLLTAVRTKKEVFSVLGLYTTEKVTVKAKAISIKPDAQ